MTVHWPQVLDGAGPGPYRAYLASPAWQRLKRATRARDGHCCQDCGWRAGLQVHHLTYAMKGAERAWQLITVCDSCHVIRHNEYWRRGDREGEYLQRDFLGGNTRWRRENWPRAGLLRRPAGLTWTDLTRREQSYYASAILESPGWELNPPLDAPA